ncbi:MAG TPA: DUF309 domain-containing protein [Limnochordales bacterium]
METARPPASPQLPEAFQRFLALFNAGAYWESHEVLEEPWRALRSDFYQGLIIYASAFVHAQRGNPTGVRKQLAKVQRKLPPYRPHYLGIDVDEVLATTERLLARVEAEPHLSGEALRRRFPYPRLVSRAAYIRGDEPELAAGPS